MYAFNTDTRGPLSETWPVTRFAKLRMSVSAATDSAPEALPPSPGYDMCFDCNGSRLNQKDISFDDKDN